MSKDGITYPLFTVATCDRRTKVTLIHLRSYNARAVKFQQGLSNIESTDRGVGLELDDPLAIASKLTPESGAERKYSALLSCAADTELRYDRVLFPSNDTLRSKDHHRNE